MELGIPPSPELTVAKTPDMQTVAAGSTVMFDIVVESNTFLSGVMVTDPLCDTLTGPTGDTNTNNILEPTETWVYVCTVNNVMADFVNTAVVDATSPNGAVMDSDDAMVTVIAPGIAVTKTPPTQTVVSGGNANFTVTAQNTGNVALSGVVIDDPLCDSLTGPTGDTNTNSVLDVGETWSWSCTVNNVTADFTNTATVTGTPPTGPDVGDTDTADVTVENPGIAVTKTPPTQTVASGDSASFTITAQNTGDVPLSGVVIDDPLCDSLTGPTGDTNTNSVLDVGETWSWDCTVNNVTADFTNTVTVTGTPPTGGDVSDSDSADVTVLPAGAPFVEAVKDSVLSADNDGSGSVTAGDNLLYTIVLSNIGDVDALDVVLDDVPDANTTLVVGTVTTSLGAVVVGNTAGDSAVSVDIGTLAALVGEATVTFEVQIDDPVPPGVTEIVNQGVVSGSNFTDVPTDDPNSSPDDDPTTTTLGPPIQEIPSLSEWGMIALCLLLFLAAGRVLRGGATAGR